MKHIVIVGKSHSGKSETVGAICKALNPVKIFSVDFKKDNLVEEPLDTTILNGTYVIEVNGKMILVIAGAPTEQRLRISAIIEYVRVTLHVEISFIIASKRKVERSIGFSTIEELSLLSERIHIEYISRIEGTTPDTIKNNPEFLERINKIVAIIKQEL